MGSTPHSRASAPPDLLTRGDVADLLGVRLRQLTFWVWVLDEHRRYRYFELARRAGGEPRPIHEPIKPIKDLQRRLAAHLSRCYEPRIQVHGFVSDRSPTTNAKAHVSQRWVLRVDLSDFFPSIHFGRVRGMFMAFPFEYPADVATLLAQICCHKKRLPQGAPTSPIISNYICRRMDRDLARLARAERCYYTRYADDLSFSTDRSTFPASLGYQEGSVSIAGHELEEIIKQNGFTINGDKTHLMRRTQRQRVTGLVVNEKANVHRDYVRSLRNLLHIWTTYGEPDAVRAFERAAPHLNWPPGKPSPSFRRVVQGRVQHVGSIKGWESPVYRALAESLSNVDDTYKPRQLPPVPAKAARLFTEGGTDGIHIAAALRHFHDRGEFTDLELAWEPIPLGRTGDEALLAHCRLLADSPQERAYICLFDRDNPQILKKAVGPEGWKDWGNGVAAVAIAPVGDDQEICIELLYRREDLTRENDEGRRIFLASEFDRETGQQIGTDVKYTVPHPAKTLIREDVHEIGTKRSVALSKMSFARAVADQRPPFENVSFEGFRPTLELIRTAVREVSPREGADD